MKYELVVNQNEKGGTRERVLRVHSVPTFAEQIRTAVEIVAIVAAGLWALYTFVYEQRIKPLSEAPSFSIPTMIDQGSTLNGVAFLTIHKWLQNTGNVPIDIAAETLSVYGEVIGRTSRRYDRIETPTNDKVTADVLGDPSPCSSHLRSCGAARWAEISTRISSCRRTALRRKRSSSQFPSRPIP